MSKWFALLLLLTTLSAETSFRFNEPNDTACISCVHVTNKNTPILYVSHDQDGIWQFLCGGTHTVQDAQVVSLENIVTLDSSINQLSDMSIGVSAERKTVTGKWIYYKE